MQNVLCPVKFLVVIVVLSFVVVFDPLGLTGLFLLSGCFCCKRHQANALPLCSNLVSSIAISSVEPSLYRIQIDRFGLPHTSYRPSHAFSTSFLSPLLIYSWEHVFRSFGTYTFLLLAFSTDVVSSTFFAVLAKRCVSRILPLTPWGQPVLPLRLFLSRLLVRGTRHFHGLFTPHNLLLS